MAGSRPRWFVNFTDFANMVKAFIGSNYLGVAYAFSQSGLALGIGTMLIIAVLTDHCCHLIVKTKHHIVDKYIQRTRYRDTRSSQQGNDGTDESSLPLIATSVGPKFVPMSNRC